MATGYDAQVDDLRDVEAKVAQVCMDRIVQFN